MIFVNTPTCRCEAFYYLENKNYDRPTCTCGPQPAARSPRWLIARLEAGLTIRYAWSCLYVLMSHIFSCASRAEVAMYLNGGCYNVVSCADKMTRWNAWQARKSQSVRESKNCDTLRAGYQIVRKYSKKFLFDYMVIRDVQNLVTGYFSCEYANTTNCFLVQFTSVVQRASKEYVWKILPNYPHKFIGGTINQMWSFINIMHHLKCENKYWCIFNNYPLPSSLIYSYCIDRTTVT